MYQWRDLKRHKCHFCLAFCSVFFIVLSTLVVTSIIAKGPVIFLKLSEQAYGEIDAFILPDQQSIYPYSDYNFVNHSRVEEVLANKSLNNYNYSPRKVQFTYFSNLDQPGFRQQYGYLMVIDTLQEKKIKIGKDYDFPPLGENQCYLNVFQEDEILAMIGTNI